MSYSLERLRADVAGVLDVPPKDLDLDADLLDHGLDSIRLMTLAERWRAAGIIDDLEPLIDAPTLRGWHAIVNR